MEHNIFVPRDEDAQVFDIDLQHTKVSQMEEW
jgi:hypothetical protein